MWLQLKAMMLGIWEFLKPFLMMFTTRAGVALAGVAIQAVAAVGTDSALLTDDDKRRAAFDQIVEDLTRQGIQIGVEVTTSMINSAIEAAVQYQKAN